MKLLCICQYYAPEPFRIADICEALVKRGHAVTVVTGLPNYPLGQIYDGYRHGKKRDEVINGVQVHRCFTVGRRHGAFFRCLNYYSYQLSSTSYIRKLPDDFDVVLVNQLSPVMMAEAGIRYKEQHKKQMALYCLDLWPESLVAGGIKAGSLLYRLFYRVSKRIYRKADRILVTSPAFSGYFAEKFGITQTKYLPQHAETFFTPAECKKEANGVLDLMFAGNVGAAQNVEIIIKAAEKTLDIPNLRWHIVGDGSELENLKALACRLGVSNVVFHGRRPAEEMPKYYSMADVMLVTMQKDPVLSLTLPGKMQTYMAAGKPILGSIDGAAARLITEARCGLCASAGDVTGLTDAIKELIKNIDALPEFGSNGRSYLEKHFMKSTFLDTLEKELSDLRQ